MTVKYTAFATNAARNAAVAAIDAAAGYPKRAAATGGDAGWATSYSLGAPGWQASLFGTSRAMHQGQDNGHLVPVDSAAEPYLASGGLTELYTQCVLIAGQSNAARMGRPDMSAYDTLVTKFGVDGSGIVNWSAVSNSSYFESLHRVGRMTPRCIWWIQGEADAGNATDAGNYQSRLTTLLAAYRSTFNNPNLPIIVALLNSSASPTHTATVRAAQQAVCDAETHTHPFDMDAYTLTDGLHYGAIGAAAYDTIAADLLALTLTLI